MRTEGQSGEIALLQVSFPTHSFFFLGGTIPILQV